MVGGADDQHADGLVGAGVGEVLEQLDQHLGVDRVAGLRPLQAQHRHALLVDLVARHRGRALTGWNLFVQLSTSRSASAAARSISAATCSRGSRKRPST